MQCLPLDSNKALLNGIIKSLIPFGQATRVFSADKTATIHLVVPTKYQLLTRLEHELTDSEIIMRFKDHLKEKGEAYFHENIRQQMAVLLDPRLKGNDRLISQTEKCAAVDKLKELIEFEKMQTPTVDTGTAESQQQGNASIFSNTALDHDQQPAMKKS